jgi:phytoene dehydrogenase-like protein
VKTDVVVIGGGPNGLTTAALLARRGLETLLVERRDTLGGTALTEEFHPGFRASTVAHTAGPFHAPLARALGLDGSLWIAPEPRLLALGPDGPALALFGEAARTASGLAAASAADAARWPEYHQRVGRTASALRRALTLTPIDLDRPRARDLAPYLGLGWALRRLGRRDGQDLLRFLPMSVADFAAEWFSSPLLRGAIAGCGVRGMLAGPRSAGTTANLLHQAALDGGATPATVLVRGGLGALTQALAGAARRAGAALRTAAEVERLVISDGRVSGVVLAGGEAIETRAVASSADLHRTVLRLVDPAWLDPEDLRRVRHFRLAGMASKVHLALSGLPAFPSAPGLEPETALRGRIHLGADTDTIERAFDEAKYGRIPRRPWLEVTIPTLADPSLAPAGRHVLSAYVQYTPYSLRQGDWDARSGEVLEAALGVLEEHAPGVRGLVLGHNVLTPLDLERTYGLTGGHPSHGETSLDQLFLARPLLGWSRYRAPLAGLYLCGAGTHPGGGVTGLPAANAAREILKDLG